MNSFASLQPAMRERERPRCSLGGQGALLSRLWSPGVAAEMGGGTSELARKTQDRASRDAANFAGFAHSM
jgi:hypothetical protein